MKKGIDYIGVGTGAIVVNEEGKIFISQRGLHAKNEKGKWEFPGGGVDFGETCEAAVVREIKEEFNIEIEIIELLEVVSHIILDENQHWVSPSYIAKHVSGEPKNMEPHKCSGFKWVTLEELSSYELSLASISNYKAYLEKYGS